MYIVVYGKSGLGKSEFGDILKNIIFRMDPDCKVSVDDESRNIRSFGSGSREHTINVLRELDSESEGLADVVIQMKTSKFREWYKEFGY